MAGLNPDNPSPGYLSGRLWAYFEALEIAATGRDATAMAKMPTAIGHPQITVKLADAHRVPLMGRLARSAPEVAELLRQRLAELADRIQAGDWSADPTADQSLWVVGYHHQRVLADIEARVLVDTAEVADLYFAGKLDAARMQIKRWVDGGVLVDGVEQHGRKWWPAAQVRDLASRRPRVSGRSPDRVN